MHRLGFALLAASTVSTATAQPAPPDYGFDFVTIGDVGNEAYNGFDGDGRIAGRGSVGYEYRIASLETRTSQFIEFMNVLGELVPQTAEFSQPASWGGVGIIQNNGTIRFELSSQPNAADFPVAGISWRLAAIYCNWLHNDKGQTLDDLNFGAYDTSTFIRDPNSPNLLDQTSRSPDSKYWIPSLDEWLKAAHYDPDKNGLDEGGWWQFPNSTDEPLIPGLPGEPGAQTSYQLDDPTIDERTIPVGSYPETQSPWGLLDVSGGAPEWTETWLPDTFQTNRIWMGSLAGPELFADLGVNQDVLWRFGAESPSLPFGSQGLRIASEVPSPSGGALLLGVVCAAGGFRRRRSLAVALLAASTVSTVNAQPAPPDYGFDFVTIGDPGNAPASEDLLTFPGPPTGGVDYEYRIMRSRVPAADYIEFVNAYWPYRNIPGDSFNFQLLGENLLATNPGAGPGEDPGIVFFFGDGTWGANASLNAAARYANWLHNGKVSEPWAFETGAYDFVEGETRVPMRNADARFWIPSPDEWNKAVYYDPNRFGEDQPGYWRWPNQTNEPLTPGLPGVGETPALDFPFGAPLGMYPDVQTPWGLIDVSGLGQELANGFGVGSDPNLLFTLQDSLGNYRAWGFGSDNPAYFRLASIVPAPWSSALLVAALGTFTNRRRIR